MLPSMFLDMLFYISAILVHPLSSGDPDTVLVYAHVVLPAVLYVQPINLTVKLVDLPYLIVIVYRLGAVVGKPR